MKPYFIVKVPAKLDNATFVPRNSRVNGVVVEEFDDRQACRLRAEELRAAYPAFHFYPSHAFANMLDVKKTVKSIEVKDEKPAAKIKEPPKPKGSEEMSNVVAIQNKSAKRKGG